MKTCSKCKETKELTEYSKCKSRKDGLQAYCKSCKSEEQKKYYGINQDKYKFQRNEYCKEWRKKNKDHLKEYEQKRKNNIERKNSKRISTMEWHRRNRKTRQQYENNYRKNKLKQDPIFKFKIRNREKINKIFKKNGYSKRISTHQILGCSFEYLKLHIERQFKKGMNWDNRDKWHIDHIIPMATAKTEEDVIRLNHYTNLRPLWAEENLSKSDKIITHQLVLL